jgi:hypothetical protein
VPSERSSIEEQSLDYCGWACCVVRGDLRSERSERSSIIKYVLKCINIQRVVLDSV